MEQLYLHYQRCSYGKERITGIGSRAEDIEPDICSTWNESNARRGPCRNVQGGNQAAKRTGKKEYKTVTEDGIVNITN